MLGQEEGCLAGDASLPDPVMGTYMPTHVQGPQHYLAGVLHLHDPAVCWSRSSGKLDPLLTDFSFMEAIKPSMVDKPGMVDHAWLAVNSGLNVHCSLGMPDEHSDISCGSEHDSILGPHHAAHSSLSHCCNSGETTIGQESLPSLLTAIVLIKTEVLAAADKPSREHSCSVQPGSYLLLAEAGWSACLLA